jgi:hypothetical protein
MFLLPEFHQNLAMSISTIIISGMFLPIPISASVPEVKQLKSKPSIF